MFITPVVKPKHICNYCEKSYSKKVPYDKHFIICEILHKSKKQQAEASAPTDTDVPSIAKMYVIIQELAYKNFKLEQEMAEIKKWVNKTKQKINIIDWLNTNSTSAQTYQSWLSNISINEQHVTYLMDNNFTQLITNILHENLDISSHDISKLPIRCFSQKQHVFYVYTNDIDTETIGWLKLTREAFINILNKIHKKILVGICDWHEKYKSDIQANDKISEVYSRLLIKLTGIDYTQDATLSKIKSSLYNYLKNDLKSMIEYEFEF